MTTATLTKQLDLGGKYLSFFLDKEEYGLMILKVQEIIGMMPVTPVPQMPHYTLGVINLRGKVIPVMDLRAKFGMMPIEHTSETCIIVVQSAGTEMGVMVDKVSEVLDIPDTSIEEAPAFGASVSTDFLLGIGKTQDSVKLLLDIDRVLAINPGPSRDSWGDAGSDMAAGLQD